MRNVVTVVLVGAVVAAGVFAATRPSSAARPPAGVITRWETMGKAQGLPDDRVFAVLVAPEGVWAGTEHGLALVRDGKVVKTYGEADGISFPVVTSLCRDSKSGAVYAGTLRGVTEIRDGKATAIRQAPDGLVNDVVYSVLVQGGNLWCATAAGLSRRDGVTGTWQTWTEKNSPMKEIWCYSLCEGGGKVFCGIWGSGILEYDLATGAWNLYNDPDRDMRFDLFKGDGVLSDVIVGVSAADGALWAMSYIGLSRYDGRSWQTWVAEDSGIASSFLSSGRAHGPEFWPCTDKGLSQFDGKRWVTYRRAAKGGEIRVTPAGAGPGAFESYPTETSLPDDFIWSVDFDGRDVWVGTARGLAHGFRNGPAPVETAERGQK